MDQETFFPKTGDYYCEAASKVFGENGDKKPLREIVFKLRRISEKDAIRLQSEISNLPENNIEEAARIQIEKSKELLIKMIVGWSGFDAEFNSDNLEICIEQMPIDVKIEVAIAGAQFARTGILEDKRSKNAVSSPNSRT